MADLKNQAYALYEALLHAQKDNVGNNDFNYVQSVRENKNRISYMVDGYLQNCRPEEKFRQKEFPNIIFLSAKDNNFHPKKTAEAFENLEHYIVLIYSMPWKKEFHKINKYCGFYQAKVHAHMRNVESVFKLIGYTEVVTGMLVQTMKPNPELLQSVAFECLMASVQCQIVYRISKRTLGYQISFSDIVYIALMQTATEDQTVAFIESTLCKVQSQPSSGNLSESQNILNGVKTNAKAAIASTDSFRNKLQNYTDHDIPYMDKQAKVADFAVGCLNEYILASLKLVEEHPKSSSSNGNTLEMKHSQKRPFVCKGITKNHGEKYYEGIHEDILKKMDAPKPHGIHLGYVQIMAQSPGYVNVDNNFVQKPKDIMQNGVFAGAIDAQCTDGGPVVNSPNFDENKLFARGIIPQNKHITDILVKKQSPVLLGSDKMYSVKSAPLAKHHAEKQVSNSLASFPVQQTNNMNTKNIDDIEIYKKHDVSAQVSIGDKILKSDNACTSSAEMLMTKSYNERLNRNVFDNTRVADNSQPSSANGKDCSKLFARGIIPQNKHITDILVKKQSPPVLLGSDKMYSVKSAPLAKHHAEKQVSNSLASFPVQQTNNMNTKNIDDIEIYKKHDVSAQVSIGDKILKSDNACTSSAEMLMTKSYNERLNRNVFDNTRVADNSQPSSANGKDCSKSTNVPQTPYSKSVISLQWHCPFCTYINSTPNNICEMCTRCRDSLDIEAPPFAGQCSRICEKCTLKNEKNADSCSVCGSVLGSTHTII